MKTIMFIMKSIVFSSNSTSCSMKSIIFSMKSHLKMGDVTTIGVVA